MSYEKVVLLWVGVSMLVIAFMVAVFVTAIIALRTF